MMQCRQIPYEQSKHIKDGYIEKNGIVCLLKTDVNVIIVVNKVAKRWQRQNYVNDDG